MKFDRNGTTIDFLKKYEDQKFTLYAIATWLVENYLEEARRKISTSKNKRIIAAKTQEEKKKEIIKIYAGEFNEERLKSIIEREPNIRIERKPKIGLYYTQKVDFQTINQKTSVCSKIKEDKITEEKVCKAFVKYLHKLNIHNMYIKHNFSSNKQGSKGNKWLHPDLVGMQVLNEKWDLIIKDCAKYHGGKPAKLWSFEVKIQISRSDLRESFFQTISNSSWAHYGYLVASKLVEDNYDTKHELDMLCNRHGIGFILVNMETPRDSQIIIPAKERAEIDWDMANRLAEENKDFKNYLNHVDIFHKTHTVMNIT